MTDKERYEAAMEENHKLREDLKKWKEAHVVINEDYRKISELYIKEQQKNGELEQINQNLTNRMIKMEVALQLREETEVTTKKP